MAERRRWTSTRAVFALLAAVLLAALLLTPATGDDRGQLTTHSAAPGGARGLADALARLGWRVERRTTPYAGEVDTAVVHAVLDPRATLTAGEAHRLLEAVRAGAGLLLVVQPGSALADSLRLGHSHGGATLEPAPAGTCPDSLNEQGLIRWPGGRVLSHWLTGRPPGEAVAFSFVRAAPHELARERARHGRDSVPATPRWSAALTTAGGPPTRQERGATLPAVLGFTLGRGRVVAVADPDLLRNDVLRVCRWDAGLTAVRAMEWLAAAGGRRVAFDEFHHGYGTHADPAGEVRRALVGTAPGRATLVLAAAALVLLAALGVRPIAPRPRMVIERRSPLEHVDALAGAYARVGASRLVTRRLVRGLRRRHATGALRTGDDADWLRAVASRHPDLAAEVARVERALGARIPPAELAAVGEAVTTIDRRLRPDR